MAADFTAVEFGRVSKEDETTDADLLGEFDDWEERDISTSDSEYDDDESMHESPRGELETLKPFPSPEVPQLVQQPVTAASRTGLLATASLLALYPLCLTLVFFLISQGLGRLPESISDRLLISGKRVPLLPPFGLESKSIKGDVQVLEDGSKVFDLKGEVHNTLPLGYRSLLIEGKLFDESNQLVARIVAPINPDILGAKINSLNKGAIDEILSKEPTDGGEISPSKMRPFRLIFTGLKNPEKVRYVGARVYSVER